MSGRGGVLVGDDIRRTVGTDMASDEDDPHGWSFDCEVVRHPGGPAKLLKVWWVCRMCRTTVRLRATVTRQPHSGCLDYDAAAALTDLFLQAVAARKETEPRCSVLRLVRQVMEE